jgi:hypothetical protein
MGAGSYHGYQYDYRLTDYHLMNDILHLLPDRIGR